MTNILNDDVFVDSVIQPDGSVQTWDDNRQAVVKFQAGSNIYWFSKCDRFEKNGEDFWVVIQFFGFVTRGAAGTQFGGGRKAFTAKQTESVKKRIVDYYSGPEDKKVAPFTLRGAHFLGVIFEEGWILQTN